MMDAIPWYQSKVYIGALVTLLSSLASLAPKLFIAMGLATPDAITTFVNAAFQIIAVVAGMYTLVKRKNSPIQPLTLTKAAAEIHPNTVANASDSIPVVQPPK